MGIQWYINDIAGFPDCLENRDAIFIEFKAIRLRNKNERQD
jgi:hypothetical protein